MAELISMPTSPPVPGIWGTIMDNHYQNMNIRTSAVPESTQGTQILLKSITMYMERHPQTQSLLMKITAPVALPI
jgi:hypothetical protein